jgi:hypothetical protein
MLTINDLPQEQELSSSDMRKVAGGNVISNIVQIAGFGSGSGSGSGSNGGLEGIKLDRFDPYKTYR